MQHYRYLTKKKYERGFSLLEALLAAGMFVVFSVGVIAVVVGGFDANRLGSEETIANQYASEGIEAMRSMKNQNFNTLVATTSAGLIRNGSNVWAFSGINNTFGKYTRVASVAAVQRDSSGNIVASGGNIDPNIKKITSTVSWKVSPTRNNSVILTTYMTNFKSGRSGMLVYGDGGTTTDAIKYKLFDANTNTWTATASAADIDTQTTNKAVRVARVYASSTRNEKILVSRHYDGTSQYIYSQVWNGVSWGNVTSLATLSAVTTFLDAQNFDGTYLNNGNFMVIYSDNTVIPKSRIWDGTTWQAQTSLTTLGASNIPNYIVAAARPGSNEIMAAFFTQGASTTTADTITQYYNGTTWSAITTHGTASITNTTRMVDFTWSANTPTIGALVFSNSTSDKTIRVRTGSASGGVFTWGTTGLSAAQTNNLESLSIADRPNTANEFVACDKDALATPTIVCYLVTHAATPTFSAATTIAGATDTGIERSFHTAYKSLATSGNIGLTAYSDNTTTPKYKKFVPASGGGAWAVVASQKASIKNGGAISSIILTLPAGATLNNRLIVAAQVNASGVGLGNSQIAVTDNKGNAWTKHSESTHFLAGTFDTTSEVWSAPQLIAGATTVTITYTGTASGNVQLAGAVQEYSGLSINTGITALDKFAVLRGTGGTVSSGNTLATTAPNELVIGGYSDDGSVVTLSAGAGYTMRVKIDSNNTAEAAIEDKDSGATGSTPNSTIGGSPAGDWGMAAVVFINSAPIIWDAAATSIATTGFTPGVFKAIRTIPQDQSDDSMVLMSDANLALYSVVYNATADAMYTTPAGDAFSQQAAKGSAANEFWYDFAWDKF